MFLMWDRQVDCLDCCRADSSDGSKIEMSSAMIAITTSSSISVKPPRDVRRVTMMRLLSWPVTAPHERPGTEFHKLFCILSFRLSRRRLPATPRSQTPPSEGRCASSTHGNRQPSDFVARTPVRANQSRLAVDSNTDFAQAADKKCDSRGQNCAPSPNTAVMIPWAYVLRAPHRPDSAPPDAPIEA